MSKDLSLIVLLLGTREVFKPHYVINENDVVLNETILFDFRSKKNKSVISNIRIEGAQTVSGKWCLNYSVWYGNGGFSSPTSLDDLNDNCFELTEAIVKCASLIKDSLMTQLKRTDSTSSDKSTISEMVLKLNYILSSPSTITVASVD